jgi:hypothetical protein
MSCRGAEPQELATTHAVLDQHLDELERRFPWPSIRAFGVTNARTLEGELDYERFSIAAYVEFADQVPTEAQSIRGVPIHFVVTGPWADRILESER